MDSEVAQIVFFVMSLLLIAIIAEPLARRIKMPFSAILVTLGFVVAQSLMLVHGNVDWSTREFHDLVFFVFLPILIFESAFSIDSKLFFKNLPTILILAIPIMLLSTFITGVLIYWGINHATGFPWVAAIITGALLSATDPVAVVALLKEGGTPKRLATIIEGESLLNDATAIVVFGLALSLALNPEQDITISTALIRFCVVFFGGLVVGIVVSFVTVLMQRAIGDITLHGLLSIIAAYFAFLLAEDILRVSGVMAVLALGFIMGMVHRADYQENNFVKRLWVFNAYTANALVFLLMGFIISINMFQERWLAMIIGIGSVLIVRIIGMFLVIPLTTKFTPDKPINTHYQAVLFWGGLRGGVTLALAFSIPKELDYWWTIQSIAFGVIIFTLFIQAPTMNLLLRRLKLLQQ